MPQGVSAPGAGGPPAMKHATAASLAVGPGYSNRICPACGAVFDVLRSRVTGGAVTAAAVGTAAACTHGDAGRSGGGSGSNSGQLGKGSTLAVSSFIASPAMVKVNCGLMGGVSQAGLFNPWDRALYLSVKHSRPFLSLSNFQKPYQGFWQAIVQRTMSTGLYFPLEDMFMGPCQATFGSNGHLAAFVAGNLAGAINGIALNPASAVKYQTWGQEEASFWRTAKVMWRDGGIRPFLKGTQPTIIRDLTFGGVYSLLRNHLLNSLESHGYQRTSTEAFIVNVIAAGLATTISGPFNYVRNIKYSFPADMTPPSSMVILRDLWHEVRTRPTSLAAVELLQDRLRIGWGTSRVAVGMAFTHQIYEMCKGGRNSSEGVEES